MALAVTRAGRARGNVHLVRLDPTLGSEIQKTRPCLVVSPDELNQHLRTVDAERLVRRLGRVTPQTIGLVLQRLQEMFAE